MSKHMLPKVRMARLWYKGTHTHPVQRVGVVVPEKTDEEKITLRLLSDGKTEFDWEEAPVRSFRRDRIAKYYSLRREVRERLGVGQRHLDRSTLVVRSV